MPGHDRTGPMGAGAHTGRGLGACRRPADESASLEDPYQYYGVGWGCWPWADGRGHRFRGGASSQRRGFGMGKKATETPASHGDTWLQQEPFLRLQMQALTAQLDRVRGLLSKYSPLDEQDRG